LFIVISAVHKKWASAIATLTNCAEAQITIDSTTAPAGAALTIPDPTCEAYIVLKGLVNVEQETTKLQAKLKNTKGFLESLNKKMSTPEYKTKVPHNVQEEDGKKATAYQTEISNIEKAIQNFQAFAT
jgi:valyl-tRNA synthetase